MSFLSENPWLITFLASELFFVIIRSRDISVLIKAPKQRTKGEQNIVNRGLMRSILLELSVFVPASALLVLLLLPLIRSRFNSLFTSPNTLIAAYALVGLVSYGFPFAAIRRIVTTIALNTLKEFASLKDYDAPPAATAALNEAGKDGNVES